jgi:hypothetical protein
VEDTDAVSGDGARTRVWLGLALAVAVAVIATVLGVALTSGGSTTTAATRPTPPTKTVRAATLPQLQALSTALGRPIYWAGARAPSTYELTTTSDGRVYVRYLPPGVAIGSPSASFLAVGTYVVPNAAAALRAAARSRGGVVKTLPGGAVIFYSRARPTSVYLAYPGASEQIEVYDPSPVTALGLVLHGKVTPVS